MNEAQLERFAAQMLEQGKPVNRLANIRRRIWTEFLIPLAEQRRYSDTIEVSAIADMLVDLAAEFRSYQPPPMKDEL